MRVLVQWARAVGRDWDEVESRRWQHAPNRPDPTGLGLGLDNAPGWVSALCVQGITFSGADHYAVEEVAADTIRVTCIHDDPVDNPSPWASVWTLKTLAPDPRFDGKYNTRQSCVRYAEGPIAARFADLGWEGVRPWSEFVYPPASITRHGKGMSDQEHEQHQKKRSPHGWREWTEGVPPGLVKHGKLKVGARG